MSWSKAFRKIARDFFTISAFIYLILFVVSTLAGLLLQHIFYGASALTGPGIPLAYFYLKNKTEIHTREKHAIIKLGIGIFVLNSMIIFAVYSLLG